MSKKIFYFVLLIVFASLTSNIYAKDKKKNKKDSSEDIPSANLREWANAQALPEEIDGMKMFRPAENNEGRAEISDLIEFPGLSGEQIFKAALVFFGDNIVRETEAIESIDYDTHRFIVRRRVECNESSSKFTAAYLSAYQASDRMLMFVDYDITFEFKEKAIISRHLEIEKLKPLSNMRHGSMIEEFSLINSKNIHNLSDFILNNNLEEVTHWSEIKSGKVVKGMNSTEVKLIGGRPVSVRESGDKIKWMFSNDFVVVFSDGKVITVIQ